MRLLLSLIAAASLFAGEAWAGYFPPLYTSTRASGMGGAYVALADDEGAIFLNPAGLAGVKGFTFNYAAEDIEMSWDAIMAGFQGTSAFSNLSGSTLNTFMGKDLFIHSQFAPSMIMPNFGVSLLSDQQFSLVEQNMANPNIALGYQLTNGFQVAYGTSVLPRRMRVQHDLRVGIAAKLLWRRGGYYNLGVIDLINLSQAPIDSLHAITGNFGRGYGADVGAQYLYKINNRVSLSTALAMTDFGNTTFADPAAQPQHSNLTWGLAATYKMNRIKANFAFDYQHILEDTDFRSRMHTGVELQMPFLSVYGGFNQMNLSYGAAFDLWIFRLTAASYAEELASYGGQNSERRYALRLALKIGF